MIPSPDFYFKLSLEISEEVLRMGCATIGFAVAVWGIVKIISLLVENAKNQQAKTE